METNNVSPQKKHSILNSLAIAGFIGVVLLLAWLSVQLVQMFPNAFSSLASLAEGVDQTSEIALDAEIEPIIVTSNASLLETGETLTINWENKNQRGSYVFSYGCLAGVAITQINTDGQRQLNCNTNYNVGDVNTLDLAVTSQDNRFTDVAYSIGFLATNDTAPQAIGTDIVTIINPAVNEFAENTGSEELVVETVEETPVPVTPPAPETNQVVTPPAPVFEQEFVYEIPTSNPNGTTDLAVTFLAIGEVNNSRFIAGPISARNGGAVQFAVQNLGTKTSRTWTFTMELPNGDTYTSPQQVPLKPNELAALTLSFPSGSDTRHTFVASVNDTSDRNSSNNSFSQPVSFNR